MKEIGKKIVRAITRVLIILIMAIFRMKIKNKEKIPKEGRIIVALNHRHYFDIIFIMSQFKGTEIRFVGRGTVKNNPFLRILAWGFNIIFVDRDGSDVGPLKEMIKTLRNNQMVGIFPEGTRKGLHKGQFKSGTTYMALRTKADIVPIGINGNLKPFSKNNYLNVGDKFNLYEMMDKNKTTKDKDEIERLNEILKNKILELVEDGFYDDLK